MKAFPNPHRTDLTGMTLRDYFAAKAMQSLVLQGDTVIEDCAILAYEMADAMLKERDK